MNNEEWKPIAALTEPYNDALNYKTKAQKEFFNRLFLRTEELRKCLAPATYFLMGEKGTGKTAYAVYLENNSIDEVRSQVTTMTETQYKRFIELKRNGKLTYSDYANIWRSMLLFLVGRMLVMKSKNFLHKITGKFTRVEQEIAKWNKNALNPEIESAFEAISSEVFNAKIKAEGVGEAGGELRAQHTEKNPTIRHHLLETENSLKEAISSLTISKGHILFVDGIDYRPESVPYSEYLECIKGLGEAVWQLNTEFFGSIKDSKGRIKVVLLVRPDVFHALNLYNSNSRLQDNTVFLDWATNEREYESSKLYEVSGKYFSTQQPMDVSPHKAWDHYYDEARTNGATFKKLLKTTFQKPRDILTFVRLTRSLAIKSGDGSETAFAHELRTNPAFTREFSDYLLGEVRNYAAFYMTQEDFGRYIKFFQYLNGKSRFSMAEFEEAYQRFKNWVKGEPIKATEYLRDPEALLQFFYDVNVVGYSEAAATDYEVFFHWSYRERSLNNIAPKVKTTGTLILNPGIAKALDIGKQMTVKSSGTQQRAPRSRSPRGHGKSPVRKARKG
ncbi:P-loop ATPase, Sll1717 family [Aromatoleum toluvorans]|uniref:P-loop ATPase, Sll1717 family n=1 Tax=Aromatoleum toluvorans TaxID=92002 RepID=UPI001B7D27EB|nr:hypothetical protein [Aromatoleum toluvorans]